MNMSHIHDRASALAPKPAVQRRSQQTRDKLIAALDELLRDRDFERISVAEIAQRAGVSTAVIYQRFSNKDAAVSMLIALYIRRVEEWWDAVAGGALELTEAVSLRDAAVQVGIAAWRQLDELHYVMRPAYLQSRLHPHLLGQQWRAHEARAVAGFRSWLMYHADELGTRDPSTAAGMVTYFFNMMFLGRLLHYDDLPSWDVPTTAEAFAEELADFVCGYLGVPQTDGPSPSAGGQS
jgi:AcrR family transcriptional regulator